MAQLPQAPSPAKGECQDLCPFVLYSLRHTFLTKLGESGCDAWTLARIAGHSSMAMSAGVSILAKTLFFSR